MSNAKGSIRNEIRNRLSKAGKSASEIDTIMRHHSLVDTIGTQISLDRKREAAEQA